MIGGEDRVEQTEANLKILICLPGEMARTAWCLFCPLPFQLSQKAEKLSSWGAWKTMLMLVLAGCGGCAAPTGWRCSKGLCVMIEIAEPVHWGGINWCDYHCE